MTFVIRDGVDRRVSVSRMSATENSLRGPELSDYTQFAFSSDGYRHCVYHAGEPEHPPLLLMSEIAGFSPGLLQFSRRLIAAGFHVYVPWLFGRFAQRAPIRNAARLCISREFAHLRAGTPAPVASWLRSLASHISRNHGDCHIGAIGMCLTGAFVIPLVLSPHVRAAVAAQPAVPCSLPFAMFSIRTPTSMRALNVHDDDISKARERLAAGEAHMLVLRARADRICPAEKIDRMRAEFPVGLRTQEYGEPSSRNCLGQFPHALFTREHRIAPDAPPGHWAHDAFADLVAFFKQHL